MPCKKAAGRSSAGLSPYLADSITLWQPCADGSQWLEWQGAKKADAMTASSGGPARPGKAAPANLQFVLAAWDRLEACPTQPERIKEL